MLVFFECSRDSPPWKTKGKSTPAYLAISGNFINAGAISIIFLYASSSYTISKPQKKSGYYFLASMDSYIYFSI